MATGEATRPKGKASTDRHRCSCGATFDSTDRLLEHAREEHGLFVC